MAKTKKTSKTAKTSEETKGKTVVRAMRWKRDHWDAITRKAAEIGCDPSVLVKHATLRAIGAETDSDQLRRLSQVLDEQMVPPDQQILDGR